MKRSEQTPGPWEWTTGDPQKRNYGIYSVEHGRIAEVLNQHVGNSRLIAAAPDLLEQLEALIVQIDSIPSLIVPPGPLAAIAKAKG